MRYIFLFIILLFFCTAISNAQKLNILDSGHNTSLRGLSVVDDNIIWASGSNGAVTRSTDGGKTFEWLTIKGFEKRDFRDIEAFDANTAIIMAIAEPALILKTKDAGKTWYKVFEDSTKGMFLDAMDFDEKGNGVVVGDPINKNLFMAFSIDKGERWITLQTIDPSSQFNEGEAFFAASGTNIKYTASKNFPATYVTGGIRSRLFYRENFYDLNIIQGTETTGANSIALDSHEKNAVIVGGDYNDSALTLMNCVLVKLKNKPEFISPKTPPHGYRSCVEYITNNKLITCGTSGVDISNDGGTNWKLISTESFHVCRKTKKGTAVFLAGKGGRIARFEN